VIVSEIVAWLLVLIFFVLSFFFGEKFKEALKVLEDIEKLVHKVNKALEDGRLTSDEAKDIVNEIIKIINEFKKKS